MSDPTFTKTPSDKDVIASSEGATRSRGVSPRIITAGQDAPPTSFPRNDVLSTDALLARSFLYRLIADLFRHPLSEGVGDRISEYKEGWLAALEKVSAGQQSMLKNLLSRLFKEMDSIGRNKWASEFDHCFGHTAISQVPAYEIEYGEEHSHRQPQELADISAFYNAFRLRMSHRVRERVDHISVECEFMSFLLHKEAYALEQGDGEKADLCRESSRRFFSEHLGRWVSAFAHKLLRHKSGRMIREIAEFVLVFVTAEAQSQGFEPGQTNMPIRRILEDQETGCISCLSKPELS
ncbi:MAG: molecular chaperone TorD family protein [Candidatus Omnitrophica bacterium]|nr:molecular chaperone TorD family protein [Candidatus Omnitrophota bacterium]